MDLQEIALSKLRKTKLLKRKHTSDQLDRCIHSIETYGQYAPIVVSGSEILCGTLVYDALRKLKMRRAKVVQLGELSEEKKKELRYLDNRTFEMSSWKEDDLKMFLMSLDKVGLRDCGFKEDEAENYINDITESVSVAKTKVLSKLDKELETWYCPNCDWQGTMEEK